MKKLLAFLGIGFIGMLSSGFIVTQLPWFPAGGHPFSSSYEVQAIRPLPAQHCQSPTIPDLEKIWQNSRLLAISA